MHLALDDTGLRTLGHCQLEKSDGLTHSNGSIVLIGPDEPAFWPIFSQSSEANDGCADPMDRWSKRTVDPIAKAAGGVAYYPSDGPPYHPFYTWALRSGEIWESPIGLLVDQKAGLWVSFRAAIWLPIELPFSGKPSPCETCHAPCEVACPVDAFSHGYDVKSCRQHINGSDSAHCIDQGCAARRACPIGQGCRKPAQAKFHMETFR